MLCSMQRRPGREQNGLAHLRVRLQMKQRLQQRWACGLGSKLIVQLCALQPTSVCSSAGLKLDAGDSP